MINMKLFFLSVCMFFCFVIFTGCNKSTQDQPRVAVKETSEISGNNGGNANNPANKPEANNRNNLNQSTTNIGNNVAAYKPDNSNNSNSLKSAVTEYSDAKIINIPGAPLRPDRLKNFLPEKIPGATRTIPSTGISMEDNNQMVTNASVTYSFKSGGIQISLHDYGKYENIPGYDKKYYLKPPNEPGFDNEVIQNENGRGFLHWDPKDNSGKLHFLLANRITIIMDAYKLPKESGGLTAFLEMIHLKNLIAELLKK